MDRDPLRTAPMGSAMPRGPQGDGPAPSDAVRRAQMEAELARLRGELQNREQLLQGLQEVASALGSALTLQQVGNVVVGRGREALGTFAGALVILDGQGGLQTVASQDYPVPAFEGDAAAARIVQTANPIFAGPWRDEPDAALREHLRALRSGGFAGLPLVHDGHALGALLFSSREVHDFPDEEKEFLVTLSELCAQACQRVRMCEEAQSARALLAAASDRLRRAQDEQRFFADASVLLGSSLDASGVLQHLADLAVPAISDWCIVHTLTPLGEIRVAAMRGPDAAQTKEAWELLERSQAHVKPGGSVDRAIRTGTSELVPDVDEAMLAQGARDREQFEYMRRAGYRSAMFVPLIGRSGVLGSLTFICAHSGRRLDPAALALAEDLARRAALAVENARLFSESERSRAQLDTVLRHMPVGVILAEAPSGRIILMNREVDRIMQAKVAPIGSKDDYGRVAAFRPDGSPVGAGEWPLARALSGEVIDLEEIEIAREDGSLGIVHVSASPVRDPSGAVTSAIATMIDVTAQTRDRRELQRTTATLGAVIGTSPLPIMLLDLDGTVRVWNRAAEELYGWKAEEVVGHPLPVADEETRGSFHENLRRVAAGEVIDGFEGVRYKRNGEPFLARVWATPVRTEAGRVQCFSIIADVTRERQVESERLELLAKEQAARREAEEATRLKDDFLAIVSHEMRTPLTAILGWIRTLELRDAIPGALGHAFAAIDRNARAQLQMVEDLLDVSRIVSGRLRLAPCAVDLRQVVGAAAEAIAPAAQAKGVRLALDLPDAPLDIVGDADRLQQVVGNLLTNAVKFTPPGGRVDVCAGQDAERVRLTVRDDGAGIDAAFLPHLFTRFRQAQPALTRREGGLGLGLAISRHLVELHGGTITARSDGPGRGATFVVELPRGAGEARRAPPPAPAVEEAPDAVLRGRRILVVEDEPDARELVAIMLEEFGASVATAASAQEGLAALARERFELLVSDVSMPEEDGYSFLRRARAAGHTVPAAALTANARREDRERALAAGFAEHIPKPVEPLDLARVLARLIRK